MVRIGRTYETAPESEFTTRAAICMRRGYYPVTSMDCRNQMANCPLG